MRHLYQGSRHSFNSVYFSVWLLVFSIPIEALLVVPPIGSLSRVIGLLAFSGAIIYVLGHGHTRKFPEALIWASLFLIWSLLSCFWSVNRELSFGRVWTYIQLVGMVWVIWETADSPARLQGFMRAYALGGVVAAGATLSSLFTGDLLWGYRAVAGMFDPNELALGIAITIPFLLKLFQSEKRLLNRFLLFIFILMDFISIVATGSRGGILASFMPIIMFLLIIWHDMSISPSNIIFTILISFVMYFSILILIDRLPLDLWLRISSIPAEFTSGNMGYRGEVWGVGFDLFRSHWVIGVGVGAFQEGVAAYFGHFKAPHNTFLAVYTETGIIGGVLFCVLLLNSFIKSLFMRNTLYNMLIFSFLTWFIGAQALGWDYGKPIWLIISFTACAFAFSPIFVRTKQVSGQALINCGTRSGPWADGNPWIRKD